MASEGGSSPVSFPSTPLSWMMQRCWGLLASTDLMAELGFPGGSPPGLLEFMVHYFSPNSSLEKAPLGLPVSHSVRKAVFFPVRWRWLVRDVRVRKRPRIKQRGRGGAELAFGCGAAPWGFGFIPEARPGGRKARVPAAAKPQCVWFEAACVLCPPPVPH